MHRFWFRHRADSARPSSWASRVGLPVVVGLLLLPVTAGAQPDRSGEKSDPTPKTVFELIAHAWEAGDARGLAELVHSDGLRATSAAGDRGGHYSPSQAYYYFKNLFRSHRTLMFEFHMMQDESEGDRAHAMAAWKRRRVDSEKIETFKVVCVLAREDGRWRLAELNTIR